jgi:hypothetical protein
MSTFNTPLWNGNGGGSSTLGVTTANDIIYAALRALGVLRPGMTASSDAMADGLAWLNDMVDAWNAERLMIPALVRETMVLTPGTQEYAMPGNTSARPGRIEHAGIVVSGSTIEDPIELLTAQRWAGIALKSQAGTPSAIYDDRQMPTAYLYVWPVPVSADTLALYGWQTLAGFADLTTEYGFGPGYVQALKTCLASAIAPHFIGQAKIPQPLLSKIDMDAVAAKARIKSRNTPMIEMRCDPALTGTRGGRWDVISGGYR